ncbi:PR-1-like protein [Cucurbitaria berberidis CBS 394.84]|uniref:PR-1-like protein n=1 Tax=Cucurbitaria berberidis CBS 394.84 TaxID=1168544 RepID=A0A9P4GFH1_9PLEO|nr:PR-1-like protein [Cucurbitaria berberidis CBS 394.84]KAF1844516.1 PR-1-like protein [Cucurbitaria berberidis CBS 394.84]
MRSSILFASALALGVLARPQPHRRKGHVVTETDVVVTTLTIFVTEPFTEPASTSLCTSTTASQEPTSTEVSSASPLPPTSTPDPEPTTTPAPEPTSFELVSSSTPTPSPSPSPSPEPQPEPEPEPSSSTAPAPVSSATPTPVSNATPTSAPATPSSNHVSGKDQAYLSSGADYQAAVLYHHNAARANHDAKPLTWDADCETNARIAAQKCTFEHYIPSGAGQGQNLFTVSGTAFNVTAGITESWYKGELEPMMPYFGQKNVPDNVFHSVGHLTQLVWKGTTKVGCVSIDCGSNMMVGGQSSSLNKYTVCNYAPAGNVGGGYAANVAAPISTTNLGGWAD